MSGAPAKRMYAEKKRMAGLCGACGKRPLKTKRLCAECQAKANNYQRMRREVNRDYGFTARGTRYVRTICTGGGE